MINDSINNKHVNNTAWRHVGTPWGPNTTAVENELQCNQAEDRTFVDNDRYN